MNDTAELEFPPIDAGAPPSPQTAVAVAAAQARDLEKMDLNAIVRSGFQPARDKAAEATKTLTGVVHDLSTQAAVDKAKTLRHRLIGQPLADVRKLTKGIKSRLAAASRVAGEEEDKAVAAFNAADALITPQIEAREAELEAERQAKAQAEAERKAKHEANLQRLATAALRAREKGADSAEIATGIAAMEAYAVTDAWEEFRERAEAARVAALADLQKLHAEVKAREEQAAENERLRLLAEAQAAELERLRKAEAERQEIEAARQRAEAQEAAAAAAGSVNGKADTPGPCEPEAAPITTNAHESGSPADAPAPGDAPGMCAGADPEASNGSDIASDEGPAAQEVLRAAGSIGRVPVERDSLGHFWHPGIDLDLVPEDTSAEPFLRDLGYETAYISMESDAPQEVVDRYFESGDPDCREWTPSAPSGDGWFLAAIYDHEDGPHACWLRPSFHQPTGPAVEACRPETVKETTQRGADQPTAAANAAGAGDDAKRAGELQGPEDRAAGGYANDSEMTAAWPLPTAAAPRVIFAEPEPEDQLREQTAAFVKLVLLAYEGKYPSHPKPAKHWWDEVKEKALALQAELGEGA